MAFAVNSVELANGVRLPYVEQGDPRGVPVLLDELFDHPWTLCIHGHSHDHADSPGADSHHHGAHRRIGELITLVEKAQG